MVAFDKAPLSRAGPAEKMPGWGALLPGQTGKQCRSPEGWNELDNCAWADPCGTFDGDVELYRNGFAQDIPTPVRRPATAPVTKPVATAPGAKATPAANAPAAGIGTAKPACCRR